MRIWVQNYSVFQVVTVVIIINKFLFFCFNVNCAPMEGSSVKPQEVVLFWLVER